MWTVCDFVSFFSEKFGEFLFLQHSYFIKLVSPRRAEEGRELLQTPNHMVLMWEV